MQRVAKNVRRVTLEIESVTYGSNFLKAISQCAALRTLEVTFVRVDLDAALAPLPSLPRSISHVFIRFILIPDGRRVLELLARSPALETWDLGGLYDLNLRLPTFPTLVPKLRRVQLLRNAHLAELATLPLRLRELVVGLDVDRGRLWATRNLLEGLRELRFEYGATSDLLSAALPESLEKLTIDGALLSLEPGEFTAVREKLDRPGLRVVLVRKIHYGASSWNREEEVAFWRSMPNVVIEM
ncbi:hypothetical protein DFJ74DRAFT_658662 [Hyaloraphidium curvatum]|nr:hypothetical protein DFJ74DRAFT_658662 [Hyaloraphidium curvatum]